LHRTLGYVPFDQSAWLSLPLLYCLRWLSTTNGVNQSRRHIGRERFFEAFEYQLALLEDAPVPFRAFLHLALLDQLAATRFPGEPNGSRFSRFVREFAAWPDTDRVSLHQIQASKLAVRCPRLAAEVDSRLRGWELGARIWRGSEVDPFAGELATVQEATTGEAKAATDLIDRCRYVSLLWMLRNFRAHEGRSPSATFPFEPPMEPYYFLWGLTEPDYRLVIPDQLVRVLTVRAATNLRGWFETEDRDPYDSFPDRKSWIG
jgi:hypothetical protein